MAPQYIYHMQSLSKTFTGGKQILKDIHLSFYPDAKIGVVGVNGSGKSTLLKIMAGLDTEFQGEAFPAEGAKVGYLAQEPQLDESKSVGENVMVALSDVKDMVDRFNAIGMEMGEEGADFDALSIEMGDLQEKIDAGYNLLAFSADFLFF